jgi:hypothetical protein
MVVGCFCLALATPVRAADPDPKELIAKAIKAMGGEEKLAKYKAAVSKGKGTFYVMGMGINFTGEFTAQLPKQTRMSIEFDVAGMKGTLIQVFNGDKGWTRTMDVTMELAGDQLAEAKDDQHSDWVASLLPLKDSAYKLAPLGESKVADRPAYGVKVSHAGNKDISLFFDKETGLLVKVQHRVKDQQSGQEMDQEAFLSKYEDVNGIMHAKKIKVVRDGKDHVELEFTDIQDKEKLDDSVFNKPE